MTGISGHLPILQVLVPFVAAVLVALLRHGKLAWLLAMAASLLSLAISVLLLREVWSQASPVSYMIAGWSAPYGIEYRVDRLNVFLLLIVNIIGAAIMPYAAASVGKEITKSQQPWFYTMYLLCLTGLLGITISGDAFNIFVFMEISSLATYVLIAMGRHRRALVASYQYLIIGTIGATLYVIGAGLLYLSTGSLNLADIAARLDPAALSYGRPLLTALAFLSAGICLKLALFPLHLWLPNAYAYAPSVVSAFLAGTATKVAVYLLVRIYYSVYGLTFGLDAHPIALLLMGLSIAAMLVASLNAIMEGNAKRMMAYSSVAQLGYITLGIALANTHGLTGGLSHIFNHAIAKAAVFLALGAVFYRTGTVTIADMAGLGRRMPLTMASLVVAGLGLVGVPGTAGFVSKWYLVLGALEQGLWLAALAILVSSLLAVIYVWRLVEAAYFREASDAAKDARDPPFMMLLPILALSAMTLYFGFETRVNAGLAQDAATMLLEHQR